MSQNYVSKNLGWECPKCGATWSPMISGCPECNSKVQKTTASSSDNPFSANGYHKKDNPFSAWNSHQFHEWPALINCKECNEKRDK